MKKASIFQFYDTKEVLGEGAFGKVFKVIHKQTGFVRAMK
jgi:calcium-dependent protein kinase